MNGQDFMGILGYDANHLDGLDRDVTVVVSLTGYEDIAIRLLKKEGFEK